MTDRGAAWFDLTAVGRSLWCHREVAWELARREVLGRYRGSVLGLLWSLCQPLLMLAIYTLVFGYVFRAQWAEPLGGQGDFAMILFAGLVLYGIFAECVTRAPTLVVSHPSYVRRVRFPIEILPWVAMGSALFHAALSLVVLLVAHVALRGLPGWTVLTLPLVVMPLLLFTMAVSWLLASLGVFFRDATHSVGVFVTAMLFLSPVFYPLSSLPAGLARWAWLNPLATPIESFRAIIFGGPPPSWIAVAIDALLALIAARLALLWFERTKPAFADVL